MNEWNQYHFNFWTKEQIISSTLIKSTKSQRKKLIIIKCLSKRGFSVGVQIIVVWLQNLHCVSRNATILESISGWIEGERMDRTCKVANNTQLPRNKFLKIKRYKFYISL